jgi:DNA gyrase/topoisomerase IV subunit B
VNTPYPLANGLLVSHESCRPYSAVPRAKPGASAVKELRGKPEIMRFKGLGEISPKEFAQFIGKEMRLSKVEYAPRAESGPIFNFYMGKNTPERKDYIIERLVVLVEE